MLLCVSKANNMRTFLQRSWLSMFVPFSDLHNIHVFAGRTVAVDAMIHAACHLARWALQGNMSFLWTEQTGQWHALKWPL